MRTRLGLKVLGLSALVMGVMAIGTTGAAQAETGACWGYIPVDIVKEEKVELPSNLTCFTNVLEAQPVIALESSTGTLLVGNQNIEVLCTGVAFIEGGTLAANGSILLGRVEFSGCISLSKTPTLTKLNACTPKDPVTGTGRIRTEKGTGLIVLHLNPTTKVNEPVLLINDDPETPEPDKDILAKIFLGPECAVGEELIVTGELILQDIGGKAGAEEHKVTHLIREFPGLQLMRIGGVLSTLDGTANVTLGGAHLGFKWGSKAA